MARIMAAVSLLLLATSCFLLGSRDGRMLPAREQASLIGGQGHDIELDTFFNACCAQSSNCTLPSATTCGQMGRLQCLRSGTTYYYTSSNQNICSGMQANQICNSDVNASDCVVSYGCLYGNGTCYQDPNDTGSSVAQAPDSCAPDCP